MNPGIYAIRCVPTGECYVGQSHNMDARRKAHFKLLAKGRHSNSKLQAAYDRHGADALAFEVLEECHWRLLSKRERYWTNELKPTLSLGGILSRGTPNLKNRAHWARKRVAKLIR